MCLIQSMINKKAMTETATTIVVKGQGFGIESNFREREREREGATGYQNFTIRLTNKPQISASFPCDKDLKVLPPIQYVFSCPLYSKFIETFL